jgi:hypothetical protein
MAAGDPSPLSIIRAIGEAALSGTDRVNQRVTALYDIHRDGLYRFLVAQGIPPARPEVTQDVFVKLFIALRDGTEIGSDQVGCLVWPPNPPWTTGDGKAPCLGRMDMSNANGFIQDPSPEAMAVRAEELRRVDADQLSRSSVWVQCARRTTLP